MALLHRFLSPIFRPPWHRRVPRALRGATLALCLCLSLGAGGAWAEPLGRDATGRMVDANDFKGRVLLVFRWSTACAVCMDKWPELRANARGWLGRPFTLVAISTDAEPAWRDYERLVASLQPSPSNIVSLRADADPRIARLPVTEMRDAQGRTVSRIEGRVPAALWDDLADLLP